MSKLTKMEIYLADANAPGAGVRYIIDGQEHSEGVDCATLDQAEEIIHAELTSRGIAHASGTFTAEMGDGGSVTWETDDDDDDDEPEWDDDGEAL